MLDHENEKKILIVVLLTRKLLPFFLEKNNTFSSHPVNLS